MFSKVRLALSSTTVLVSVVLVKFFASLFFAHIRRFIVKDFNVNCTILKGHVHYLIQQELVEERTLPRQKTVYSATQRGLTVLKHFRELKQVLPIGEAAQNQE